MTLADARAAGHRWVRRPPWPPDTYLEFIAPEEVPQARPPLEAAWHTAVAMIYKGKLVDRLYWRLPWEDYEPVNPLAAGGSPS